MARVFAYGTLAVPMRRLASISASRRNPSEKIGRERLVYHGLLSERKSRSHARRYAIPGSGGRHSEIGAISEDACLGQARNPAAPGEGCLPAALGGGPAGLRRTAGTAGARHHADAEQQPRKPDPCLHHAQQAVLQLDGHRERRAGSHERHTHAGGVDQRHRLHVDRDRRSDEFGTDYDECSRRDDHGDVCRQQGRRREHQPHGAAHGEADEFDGEHQHARGDSQRHFRADEPARPQRLHRGGTCGRARARLRRRR